MAEALRRHGGDPAVAIWCDPAVDWGSFDLVAIRTTWDYHLRLAEFLDWLQKVTRVTRVVNDPALVRFNYRKTYLRDLQSEGVAIVPTRFLESKADVEAFLSEVGWKDGADWVLKPAIGASALGVYRTQNLSRAELEQRIEENLGRGGALIQRFMPQIESEGELSLAWIDGRVAHAVRKLPAAGDFRVQVEHGGRNERVEIPGDLGEAVARWVGCLPAVPLFARIDLVNSSSGWQLMEFELIEPELMFEWAPESADILAGALLEIAGSPQDRGAGDAS